MIPDSVTNIGSFAFLNCTALTSILIPKSVDSIGASAFDACRNLDVYITDVEAWFNIEYGDEFWSHPNFWNTLHILDIDGNEVTELVIPEGITVIPACVFAGCTALKSIVIPASVKCIENRAFFECFNLIDVYITDVEAWLNIEYAEFSSHPNSEPDSVVHILDANGNEVTELVIPAEMTAIPNDVFKNFTGLTSVIIPDSVTSIGDAAFSGCTNLKNVYFYSTIPPAIGNDVFACVWDFEDFNIYVPEESYDLYMNITDEGGWWQSYALDNIRTWKVE